MATPATDTWDAMDNPEVRAGISDFFGQIRIDSFFCVLVKGTGVVPFDPNLHQLDQRRTRIEMEFFPLAEMNISYDVSRKLIAESREWAGIVLPSIKALGISARDLNNKWVHMVRKETGTTYTSKRDGQQHPEYTFTFTAAYENEAACRAAYQALANGGAAQAQSAPAAAPAPTNGNGANGTSKEKETAAKFLKPIIENAVRGQTDLAVIRNTVALNISNMPPVAKWFSVDSPEVATLIFEAMSK